MIDSDNDDSDRLGGAVGGVKPADLPQIVENLVTDREHEYEIWIRPERFGS